MKTKAPMKPNTKVNCNSVEISDIDRAFIMFTERFGDQVMLLVV